jgi:hypothetical protein
LPSIQKLQEELADRDDVIILAMNTGQDSEKVVADYWKKEGFTFDAVLDPPGKESDNARALGLKASPTNIVVDKDGKVTYASVGFDEDQIRLYLGL